MSPEERRRLEALDDKHVWHPFTPHAVYREEEPLLIEAGEGPYLIDAAGNRLLDGVSSIWCNVFGHRKAEIDEAIRLQLDKIAHATFLGNATVPAIKLAKVLADLTPTPLTRVFYSDSGSTAVEVALKIALQYWQQTDKPGGSKRHRFATLTNAYHGDTVGSVSLGGIDLFHARYGGLLFDTIQLPSPYEYRFPPDSRGRSCAQACIEDAVSQIKAAGPELAALFVEPGVQGAAGMIVQPPGYLKAICQAARDVGALVIFDEVAVGFGRSGDTLFAAEKEGFTPDVLCLAKGITGGYLPLAATMTTEEIFKAFLGPPTAGRTFFHGHTYTGNPLAAAAALATMELIQKEDFLPQIRQMESVFATEIERLGALSAVGDIRRWGLMAAVELVQDRHTKESFPSDQRIGMQVCRAARERGVFLRPLGDSIIFVPPLSLTDDEVRFMMDAAYSAIEDVLGK